MGTVKPVTLEQVSEEMRQFVKANTHSRTETEEERSRKVFPFGYAALLEAAQTGSKVPLFLFERGEKGAYGMMMTLGLSDLDAMNEMEFTTDVNAFAGGIMVLMVEADQLPQDWVLNPEDLPCDEKGAVRWDKILDDVYRNNKHYQILADWRKVRLSQDIRVPRYILSLGDAQAADAIWRAGRKEKAFDVYMDGLITKSGLELNPETNTPKTPTTPDQLYAAQFKSLVDLTQKRLFCNLG